VRDFLAKNPPVDHAFQVSDAMVDDFKQHITKRGVQFEQKDFDDNRAFVRRQIKYEIFYNKFGVSDAAKVLLEDDPQILKAVELIPEAKELASKARRQLAEKR
jgi:carboxyl-terminal processing protease